MPRIELSDDEERARVVALVDEWAAAELAADGPLEAVERIEVTDRTASHRWLLRFHGEEKDSITLWLTYHQRTLHYEAQMMPAPEENVEEVLAYLLRKNAGLIQMSFAFGPEDAIYLMGRIPASLVDVDELDRIAGCSVLYVDEHFPTAMSIGFASTYRRPRRRR